VVYTGWEVDGTGSGSCPMVDFVISGVESRKLYIEEI
jgi:hypothetical protein